MNTMHTHWGWCDTFCWLSFLGTYSIICSVIEFFWLISFALFTRSHTSLKRIFMVFVVRVMYSEVFLHPHTHPLSHSLCVFHAFAYNESMIWLLKISHEWRLEMMVIWRKSMILFYFPSSALFQHFQFHPLLVFISFCTLFGAQRFLHTMKSHCSCRNVHAWKKELSKNGEKNLFHFNFHRISHNRTKHENKN